MKLSFVQAIRLFLFLTLSTSGIAWSTYGIYYFFWQQKLKSSQYKIVALVQAASEGEALKNSFLMELLELSIDIPKNLYAYDLKEGENRLKSFPLIRSAKMKRIPPGSLFVEYSLRKPVAFLKNFTNTALDDEGTLIPFSPFFSPKQIPELKIDLQSDLIWGKKVDAKTWMIFNGVQDAFNSLKLPYKLLLVDLSKIDVASQGDRRLTLVFEVLAEKPFKMRLYLNPQNYVEALKSIQGIEKVITSQDKDIVIDLRIPQIAFASPQK